MTSGRARRRGAGSAAGAAGDTARSGEGAEAFSSDMALMRTGHGYSSVNLSDLSAPRKKGRWLPTGPFRNFATWLQRAGHDLGGRSRAFVDQHHDGFAVRKVAAASIVTLGIFGFASARGDHFSAGEEIIGHRDGLIQKAARIVAQIQDIAPQAAAH